ncbi:MAG TPA: hypothetical protein PKM20_06360 [Nitrosomonas sp.]|uniref:hypothetical protein n=1 Tax=Nitrosomonas sp. TaxID=42353 RepID=UPI000E80384A|nr:hypothetical protein [Nitrosomonas sp.]GJL74190.1 MAG: hypothetical protein NMNS02_02960 [Nitrosomonas sp.]HBV20915.1 hypothetical protein [Nitrosomonas sp.]HNP26342.1 hypothetical protein [Nitrosomonas sp.]
MIKLPDFIKYLCACSILVLLPVLHPAIAGESPAAAPCVQQSASAQPCSFELPEETIQTLKIDAGFGWGIFNGSIYNGNSEYTITQLVVSMEPIHDHHSMEMTDDLHAMSHETRIKQINVNLQPLAKGALSLALDDDVVHMHDFNWKVLKVFGHKAR